MKIAILGNEGFVGRNISEHLSKKHSIVNYNRKNINLLDISQVTKELNNNKFDVIINAAVSMTDSERLLDTRNNLTIFMNFFNRSNYFGKFINLGSGAEYDRSLSIDNIDEEKIFYRTPLDSYGYSQNIKTRLCYEKDNFFGLKLFGCFGKGEKETRIFPRLLNNKIFTLEDRYFDFFYIKDFLKVIDSHLNNDILFKDLNCVYEEKTKISDVVQLFCSLNNLKVEIKVNENKKLQLNYTGSCEKIRSLKLNLLGLKKGLGDYNL